MRSFVTNALIGAVSGLLVAGGVVSCISDAPIVPETPANQAQIQSCQSTATLHNGFVVGDFSLGGIAASLASTSAAFPGANASAKTDLAITAGIVAGATMVATALTGYSAATFANSNCGVVVGALPVLATQASDAGAADAVGQ
jgi:hypothetical protein